MRQKPQGNYKQRWNTETVKQFIIDNDSNNIENILNPVFVNKGVV